MEPPATEHKPVPSKYELRVLDQEWNERILQLTRESPVQAGAFQILFDRSPDIFMIPELTSYKNRCLGLFEDDKLLGYAMACYQKRYIHQQVANVIYLGNMHVIKRGLGRELLKRLEKRFQDIIPKGTGVEFLYAYVIEHNKPAMRLVDLGHLFSSVIGQISMVTILLLPPVQLSKKFKIRRAKPGDVDSIVDLLENEHSQRFLAPYTDRKTFEQNLAKRPHLDISDYYIAQFQNEVVGVCSAWDMTSFKKNRVLKYSPKMKLVRLLYNPAARLFGSSKLPNIGEAFRDITIAEYAVKNRNPEIFEALLRHIYTHFRKQGYHSIIVGSSTDDPLLRSTDIFLKKEIRSNVILGSTEREKILKMKPQPLVYADAIQI